MHLDPSRPAAARPAPASPGAVDGEPLVVPLDGSADAPAALVGGKAASLAALARIDGVRVPAAWGLTTAAFRAARSSPDAFSVPDAISVPGEVSVPDAVRAAIAGVVAGLGEATPLAARSSAVAEDRADASFAGQHDSFLDVVGVDAVVDAVDRCWASLASDRAIAYRARAGAADAAEGSAAMAVVIQVMVRPRAAGVLFTADPVTGRRDTAVIEAVAGLGDALVAGRVPAAAVLADDEALELVALGRRIEAAFGAPQDIEWCLDDDGFAIVQSRPITTAYPVPERDDDEPHVYVSVGHQQMMTDAMAPLGWSVFQLCARPPMFEAGGRLFVDVGPGLASPATRDAILEALGRSDPMIGDALRTVVERGELPPPPPPPPAPGAAPAHATGPTPMSPEPVEPDPDLAAALAARLEAEAAEAAAALAVVTGPEVFAAIRADIAEMKQLHVDPQVQRVLMAGMEPVWWIDERVREWLGERGAADALARSVPGDVASAMGLDLLGVADAARPHPEVVAFLADHEGDEALADHLAELDALDGGAAFRAAFARWLDRYGARGPGEIDVTRPRFADRPDLLVPTILGHVRTLEPGEAARRIAEGEAAAADAAAELLDRVRALPDGEAKAAELAASIARLRAFLGFREHPKFAIVLRLAAYRRGLTSEAERLAAGGVLRDPDDACFLTFDELEAVATTGEVDPALIDRRRVELRANAALRAPRVLTSRGEAVVGRYRRDDVPPGALVGLAVSVGVAEGRARVVHDPATAAIEPGDILVTAHTDPAWTPLFVAAAGLVTEVGGLMTHGAVVAREYGLPAVVGVVDATTEIPDGARIRVDGTNGLVELLDP